MCFEFPFGIETGLLSQLHYLVITVAGLHPRLRLRRLILGALVMTAGVVNLVSFRSQGALTWSELVLSCPETWWIPASKWTCTGPGGFHEKCVIQIPYQDSAFICFLFPTGLGPNTAQLTRSSTFDVLVKLKAVVGRSCCTMTRLPSNCVQTQFINNS